MPIDVIYTLEDRKGKQATTSVKLADATTETNVTTFGVGFGLLADAIVNGVIRAITAVYQVDISSIGNNTPSASSDVEEIGAFEFVTANGNRVKLNIPGINENLVVNETGNLDLTETAIANIITMMEDGIAVTGGTVSPCDIGEDDIVGTLFARERSRNSGARKIGGY